MQNIPAKEKSDIFRKTGTYSIKKAGEELFLIWLVVAASILCLLLGKREMVFRIVLRTIVGGVAIVTVNMALDIWGMPSYVGVNIITLSVCGFLGLPGILGLYGLSFYQYFY